MNTSLSAEFTTLPIRAPHVVREHVTGSRRTKGHGGRVPDGLGSVDDLFDPGHTQGDVHGGHAGKVEGLQGHLGAWLTNALGTECTHCRTRLHLCPGREGHGRKVWRNCWEAVLVLSSFNRQDRRGDRVRRESAPSWAVVATGQPGVQSGVRRGCESEGSLWSACGDWAQMSTACR